MTWMAKRKKAAHFWNSLMTPIWKVLWAAQATEIKCKRPLRLEVCRLGIITLWAFEKGKAVNTPGGRESKHRALLWEADARAQWCQSRPRGHSGLQIKSRPARHSGRMKGKSRLTLPVQEGTENSSSVDISNWAAPGTTRCVPSTSLLGKLRQFGESAENSNKSEWIQEPEERAWIKD